MRSPRKPTTPNPARVIPASQDASMTVSRLIQRYRRISRLGSWSRGTEIPPGRPRFQCCLPALARLEAAAGGPIDRRSRTSMSPGWFFLTRWVAARKKCVAPCLTRMQLPQMPTGADGTPLSRSNGRTQTSRALGTSGRSSHRSGRHSVCFRILNTAASCCPSTIAPSRSAR